MSTTTVRATSGLLPRRLNEVTLEPGVDGLVLTIWYRDKTPVLVCPLPRDVYEAKRQAMKALLENGIEPACANVVLSVLFVAVHAPGPTSA